MRRLWVFYLFFYSLDTSQLNMADIFQQDPYIIPEKLIKC